MKLRRTSTCFVCHQPETLLVRYVVSDRMKKTKYQHYEYRKRTATYTYMAVCTNPSCWRYQEPLDLAPHWEVKSFKILPPDNAKMEI